MTAMMDPRIPLYREAARRMMLGDFQLSIPIDQADELARLGQDLLALGRALEVKFEELNRLVEVTGKINAGLLLDEVLDHVFECFRPIIPYHRIGFSLLENDEQTVRARWARSDAPEMKIPQGYSAPLKGSSLEGIIQTGEPRIINDLKAHLREHPTSDSTRRVVSEGMRSSLTCPLITMGKPVGFMFFSSMEPNTYRDLHVEIFLQIAGQLATILEKSRLYQQLVELNELKNKFLGIAAHDLRNPLTAVKGFTKILLHGALGELSEAQREAVSTMERSSEKMLSMVNDLLDVSAIEAGQLSLNPREVNIREQLREVYEANSLLANTKSIALRLDVSSDLPERATFDPNRIEQVIDNLITNAIKFSHPGTEITLRAGVEGTELQVGVADQGLGIPEEEIPTIFSEFGRASVRPTAGESSTGLGLAIVKRIVEVHGGRIWVESKVGEGSTFTFALPLAWASR